MKKILITGANGLLGQALIRLLSKRYEIIATSVEENAFLSNGVFEYHPLDISHLSNCKQVINNFVPDVIINPASFTHVDECERQKELCWQINVKGVENLANIARRYDIHLIHYSTDYVFDGNSGPYAESDRPLPIGYYGKSKLASENVLRQIGCPFTILRTCVIYGTGIQVKKNFFLWVLEKLKEGKSISVVTDQYNNPTLAEDLARGTEQVIEQAALGLYHMAGPEYINRFEFASRIASFYDLPLDLIHPIESGQLKQAAPRPGYGGLKIELASAKIGYGPRSIEESLQFLKWEMDVYEKDK